MKHSKITCPCCNSILIFDRIEEKVVEVRKPILEQSTGDRFKDAFIKSQQQKAAIDKKFKDSEKAHQERSKSLQEIFNKSLKKVKESGDKSKPETPFGFD